MTLPDSLLAYSDCIDIFEQALSDPVGARIEMPNWDKANYLRMRMHKARSVQRRLNSLAYEQGHQMHGASVYDEFKISIKGVGDKVYLYLERMAVDSPIEGLDGVEDDAISLEKPRSIGGKITVNVTRRV